MPPPDFVRKKNPLKNTDIHFLAFVTLKIASVKLRFIISLKLGVK